jgi:DNA-binding NarL/FixJ family response regulator
MKVLIVDDHVTVGEGVRRLLAPFPEIIAYEASSAPDAIAAFLEQSAGCRVTRYQFARFKRT